MNNFLEYQKFIDEKDFQFAIEILKTNNIDFKIEDKSYSFNDMSPNQGKFDITLFIKDTDIAIVDSLLLSAQDESPKHYLYDFSDKELIEVLTKDNEWSLLDVNIAKQILKERGKEINEELLASFKEQRIEDLSKPEESQKAWIWAGYFLAILGGILSIFIGLHLKTYKKKLPNGEKVYAFSTSDRKHGQNILIIGIFFSTIYLLIKLYYEIIRHSWYY